LSQGERLALCEREAESKNETMTDFDTVADRKPATTSQYDRLLDAIGANRPIW
jgi:hypothetical protein